MKPIRLLHITNVPEQLRTFLGGQVRFVKFQGIEVHAASAPGELLQEFADVEQVPVHAVPMTRNIAPWRDLRSVWSLWRKIRKVRPDIVHAHSPKGGLLGMIAATLARTPIRIYHIRGLPFVTARGWKRRILVWTERLSCGLAHQVYCVSHSMRQIALAEGFAPAAKLKVFGQGSGNGIDAARRFNPQNVPQQTRGRIRKEYGIPLDALVLGFVGRIGIDKGIRELVEAWRVLREEFPHVHLLVVGPLESKDRIPLETEHALKNDSRIHLAGVQWETPQFYTAMDMVLLPTYREGLPNVPLEAAAMELPVVATSVPGCTDAVQDGVTGLLVPSMDANALCDAIRTYVQDSQLRRDHGKAGRERVLRDFRPQTIWREVYEAYVQLSSRTLRHVDVVLESERKRAA